MSLKRGTGRGGTREQLILQQEANRGMAELVMTLTGVSINEVRKTDKAIRQSVSTTVAAGVVSAVEQSTVLLEAHAEQVASTTQLGHVKESDEIPVAPDGTMTLGAAIPHAVQVTDDTDDSAALSGVATGEDGTGVAGVGEAAGTYGLAGGDAGVGAAGKASSLAATAAAVAALLNAGAEGDLFRGLLDLGIVFRVRADGSIVIGGSLTLPVRTVTADATAAAADYLLLVGTRAAGVTITLPDAALHAGRQLVVKDSSGQAATWAVTVDTDGGDIDGGTTDSLSVAYGSRRYASDGADWFSW